MSKKNAKQSDAKTNEPKKEREARKRLLTLEELKDVTGGLMQTCDSNGPSR